MKVVVKGDSMWPTYSNGDTIDCVEYDGSEIPLSTVIVFNHPLKAGVICIKRAIRINDRQIFVQGDNPDPTASEDSHNFGWISKDSVFALSKQ